MEVTTYIQENEPKIWHSRKESVTKTPYTREQLRDLTGSYYSKHLDFYWRLVLDEQGRLVVKRPTLSGRILEPFYDDEYRLIIQFWPDDESRVWIRFYYDDTGEPTHFNVNNSRLMNHRFDNVK